MINEGNPFHVTQRITPFFLTLGLLWAFVSARSTRAQETQELEDLSEICMKILSHMSDTDFSIGHRHQYVQDRFPDNPLSRALLIYNWGDLGRKMVPFKYVPSRNVSIKQGRRWVKKVTTPAKFIPISGGTEFNGLRIIPNEKLNTLQVISVRDQERSQLLSARYADQSKQNLEYNYSPYKPHEGTEVILPWFAGHSTVNSHSARVFRALEVTNAPSAKEAPLGLLSNVGENWVNTSAISLDVPMHGTGPFAEKYFDIPEALAWRKEYFESLKPFQRSIVVGGRSSECMLTGQVALENPGLIKGMIWLGPTHPTVGFKEGLEGYDKVTDEYPPFISPKGLGEVLQLRYQLASRPGPKWWTTNEWKTPTLILVGSEDVEVPEKSRAAFRAWANKFPDLVYYVEIPGAAHDPFSVSGEGVEGKAGADRAAKARAKIAWDSVYRFLKKHGK